MAKKSVIEREKKKKKQVEQGKRSAVQLRNRCWKCGRPRGVVRDFGICRICLREMAHAGQIPGITKSSW